MNKSNQLLVSIISSTYNHEPFLRQCIDSVLSQSYQKIEFIMINDGSTDNTDQILRSYGNQFYWESKANEGEVHTLNYAIQKAKGDWIVKLSSDDFLYPDAIEYSIENISSGSNAIVAYSDFDLVDQYGNLISTVNKPEFDHILPIQDHLCLPGTCALFKREVFDRLGGFEPSFRILFDMYFWWCASLLGDFIHIPRVLSAFRQHNKSQSSQGGERMAQETINMVQKFFSLEHLPPQILPIRKAAISNAYFAASQQLNGTNNRKAKEYILKSFSIFPFNYLKYRNRNKLKILMELIVANTKI